MADQQEMAERLARLQQKRAKSAPTGKGKRSRRGHAAASTRVIALGAAISANVVLMSFMGPFVNVESANADSVAAASGSALGDEIVELRREVAEGDPPVDLPPHLRTEFPEPTASEIAAPTPTAAPAAPAVPAPTVAPAPAPTAAPAPAPASAPPPPPPRTSASG